MNNIEKLLNSKLEYITCTVKYNGEAVDTVKFDGELFETLKGSKVLYRRYRKDRQRLLD